MPADEQSKRFTFTLFAVLAGIIAWQAITAYADIPGDPADMVLFGLTMGRLVLVAFPVAVLFGCGLLLLVAWIPSDISRNITERLAAPLRNEQTARRLLFAALLVLILTSSLQLITTWEDVIDRLRPLLTLTTRLVLLSVFFTPLIGYGLKEGVQRHKSWLLDKDRSNLFIVILLGFILFRAATSIVRDIGPDIIGWNTTDTPLKDTDLLIVLGFIVLALIAGSRQRSNAPSVETEKPKISDRAVFVLIWLAAAAYWAVLPLQASWYLAGPTAPNFEFAPASDALVYDLTAQNMLIGESLHTNPFDDIVVRRPLYTFFIGLLRTVAGQDYSNVALLQSIILAMLPAVVYLAARQMSGRLAALSAALFVTLQGGTSIALSDVITVSHAKLLMSDVPSALGVAGFIALAFAWVQTPSVPGGRKRLLATGAVLGGLLLVRFETLLLLPITAGFAWLAGGRKFRPVIPGTLLMTAGMLLVITPWLFRNYTKTGEIYIEVPGNRVSFLFNRLLNSPAPAGEETPKVDPKRLRQEETVDPAARIISHFLHSNIQNILIFPATLRLGDAAVGLALTGDPDQFLTTCCSAEDYVRRLPFWQWYKWDLDFPPEILVPVFGNLFLLISGLLLAWKKAHWAGLLPFAYGEMHILVNAVARTSGGRYMLPVEWIWISYYAMGLLMVVLWAAKLIRPGEYPVIEETDLLETRPEPLNTLLLPAVGLLMLGSILPVGERLYPAVYPDAAPEAWVDSAMNAGNLQALLESPGSVVLYGSSMYPRYYAANDGALDRLFPSHYFQSFGRLVFFVTGPVSSGVMLPLDVPPDLPIRFGENVIVIGCRVDLPQGSYTAAAAAYFPDAGRLLVRADLPEDSACPLPALR